MLRLEKLTLTLFVAFAMAVGAAQDAQPADPITPAPEAAPEQEIPDVAWVRVAHFSPNAPEMTVNLVPRDEDDVAPMSDAFEPVGYQMVTEYIEVPTGNYTVTTDAVEGVEQFEEEISLARGNHYTLTVMGMLLPPEAQQDAEEDDGNGGILGFFRNLFGNGDGDRDRLALQFEMFEDDLTRTPDEGETLVRVIHAAPGIETVDLAVTGEQGTLIRGVEYGDASRYNSYAGGMSDLEVRLTGSRAATLTLDQINLQAGNINTIYVIGTPVAEAPMAAIGSSIAPIEAGMPAGEDTAMQAARDSETAGGGVAEQDAETEAEDADVDGADDGETEETEEEQETDTN